MNKRNQFTKDGLTGNSGFNIEGLSDIFHLSANYAATKGFVFVEVKEDRRDWERVKKSDAIKNKRHIIRCSYCTKPAISLDHSWPYLQEATYCADHRDWQKMMEKTNDNT